MIKCPKCNQTMDVEYWGSEEELVCDKCGYEWDITDQEAEHKRLFEILKQQFGVEEGAVGLEVMVVLRNIEIVMKKAAYYDKIKEATAEIVADAWEHATMLTNENRQRMIDTLFSIYYEKNQNKKIEIYPSAKTT